MNKLEAALKDMSAANAEEPAEETVSEETQSEPQQEASGDDGGDGERKKDDNPLFGGKKSEPTRIPIERFNKVWKQRAEARAEAESNAKRASELEGQVEGLEAILGEVKERYSGNIGLLKTDQEFMNALEKEYTSDPGVQQLVQRINSITGNPMPTQNKPPESAPAAISEAPTTDPAVTALLTKDARREVMDELGGLEVKPSFQKMISKYIIDSAEDLTEISSEEILTKAAQFIKENEFSEADVLAPTKAGRSTVPSSTPTPKLDAESETPVEQPKGREKENYQEMKARREATMRDLLKRS